MSQHIDGGRVKITLPAGYSPAYFDAHGILTVPTVQPGLVDGGNEWIILGMRHHLIAFANRVAGMHYSAEPVETSYSGSLDTPAYAHLGGDI